MSQDLKINLEWLNGLFWENYIVCLIYYPGIKVTDYLVGHREPNTRIDSIFRFWISMYETKMAINHYQRQHDGSEL